MANRDEEQNNVDVGQTTAKSGLGDHALLRKLKDKKHQILARSLWMLQYKSVQLVMC